jgi:hypothetical protein
MPRNNMINDRIITELRKGDMFAHEIKAALNIGYSELWEAIKQLESEGLIRRYFRETPPSATLCYCLSSNRKVPLSVRWNQGIKPWTPAAKPALRP